MKLGITLATLALATTATVVAPTVPTVSSVIAPAAADAAAASTASTASTTSTGPSGTVTLGTVRVHLETGTTQVVTVHHTSGWHAQVSLYTYTGGRWHRLFTTPAGRTGYGGLVAATKRHQGTGTTPLGTFGLISAFGTHAKSSSWRLGYTRIKSGDYWVEDNGSAYYNRYRNKSQGGFRWSLPASDPNSSERLSDYPVQYEYAVVTSYNRAQVRYRGAGIFLHVNGKGATAGCVSVPRWLMKDILLRLDPQQHPVITIAR